MEQRFDTSRLVGQQDERRRGQHGEGVGIVLALWTLRALAAAPVPVCPVSHVELDTFDA